MNKFLLLIVALSMVCSFSSPAFADNADWIGTTSDKWNLDANWLGGVKPDGTQRAQFNYNVGGGATTVDLDTVASVGQVNFENTLGNLVPYIIGTAGDTLILGNNGYINTDGTVVNTQTIVANIVLGTDCYFSNNAGDGSGGKLMISGTNAVTGPVAATTLSLKGNNLDANEITGVIANGTGALSVTKSEFGIWILSGNNTYDGLTTVGGGTLVLAGDNIGAAGGVTMTEGELDINSATALGTGTLNLNGGTIDSSSAGAVTVTTNNVQNWGDSVIFKGSKDLNLGTGTVNLGGATRTVTLSTAGKTLTVGGVISGTAADVGLTTNDQGTLALGGVNTYTGATTIGAGTTLALNATGAIAESSGVANNGTFTIAASKTIQALTGAGGVTLGANTLTIGDANNRSGIYTGVAAGTGGITTDGTGTLTLGGASTYTGSTTINAGSNLTLNAAGTIAASSEVANAGTLTIQADKTVQALTGAGGVALGANTLTIGDANNRSSAYTGIIGGTGGITKAGTGMLTLAGASTYTGATLIDVNCGTVRVSNSAALGTGAGGVTNNATLDIGSTALNIGGAYTQGAASTLMVIVSGASNGSIIATGAATATAGYTVALSVSNYVPNNQTYTIIDGATGVGAIAAPAILITGSNQATFAATTIGDDLILTASRTSNGFASAVTSGDSNASTVGTVLDTIANPSADMTTILNTMTGLSNSQTAAALDTMVPEVDAGIINTSMTTMNNFVGVAIDRVEKVLTMAKAADSANTGISAGDEDKLNGIWAKGYGSWMTQGTRNNIAGYEAWNAGTALGADHLFGSSFTLGASGGYAYGNVDSDVNNANTYINSAQVTIYGGYEDPNIPYFVDVAGSFAYNWYNGKRDINIGNVIMRTANADYGGQQYGAYLGGGYKFNITNNIEFTPLISLQWNHLRLNGYTETGAGALNLTVESKNYDQLQSGLGARVASPMKFAWGTFTPEVHGKWLYDFIGDPFAVTSNFNGGGASFGSNGCKPALNSFNAGGQLIFNFKNDVSIIGNCDTEMKDRFFGIYGSLTLRYEF